MKTIEANGTVDEHGRLYLDEPLPAIGPGRVRVLVVRSDSPDQNGVELDIDEAAWLHAIARNPTFAFLDDPAEDIYLLHDGKPFHDER